jgi:hypothetical protein
MRWKIGAEEAQEKFTSCWMPIMARHPMAAISGLTASTMMTGAESIWA